MHSAFMHRCLELAENGRGRVSPNPLVGCVIVKGGAVITEGSHEEFGGPHAEMMALRKAGDLARGATLYVNLEPCCRKGKQPPCTDAIVRAGIKTVVFGARDSSNAGSKILKKHGVDIIGPVMEPECRRLNRGFFSLIEKGRPWVTVKKAMRRDGTTTGKITDEEQDRWAHARLRAMHDAILVGSGTVIADDPMLTIRDPVGALHAEPVLSRVEGPLQPRRIILDPHHKISSNAKVLTDADAHRTLIIHEKLPIPKLLQKLREKGIASILVEGGHGVWKSFEESGCIDEIVILTEKDPTRFS